MNNYNTDTIYFKSCKECQKEWKIPTSRTNNSGAVEQREEAIDNIPGKLARELPKPDGTPPVQLGSVTNSVLTPCQNWP